VLVATDLASEGLNLQDADVVVHYDLPWNPLRLAQRVGRTVRLGGIHERVDVWWFAPPPVIERTLGTLELIRRKAAVQLSLPVPATSVVGRAHLVSGVLEQRERALDGAARPVRGHAVVAGPAGADAVIRWETAGGPLREFVEVSGGNVLAACDPPHCPQPAAAPVPVTTLKTLRRALLVRAQRSAGATLSPASRALAKLLLAEARQAGMRRDRRRLRCLDAVLARLVEGIAVGAERELANRLSHAPVEQLEAWLDRHPARGAGLRSPALETVLVSVEATEGSGNLPR
jgi:hypothetical protein